MQSDVDGSQMSVGQEVVTGAGQATVFPSQLLADVNTDPSALQDADEQTTPAPATASVGQAAALPVQVSATSQTPAGTRHTVVAGANPSAGHAAALPLHFSATSQIPAEARHTVVAGANALVGQAAEVPLHFSATSQIPAEARHTVVAGAKASPGHAAEVPVQVSTRSQVPAEARHTVDDDANPFAGQVRDVPLQVSATSQAPFAARQTVPLATGEQVPTLPVRLHEEQASVQVVLQQTPSTQLKPDTHWLVAVQTPPLAWNPHPPLTQIPGQLATGGVTQSPAPSHVEAGVIDVDGAPVEQTAALHLAPDGHLAHCPAWHWPVVPQVVCTWAAHRFWGSALAVTPTQTPRLPAMLQA
jgi:hypothetical protein